MIAAFIVLVATFALPILFGLMVAPALVARILLVLLLISAVASCSWLRTCKPGEPAGPTCHQSM